MSSGKLPLIPIGALGIGFLLAIIAPLVGDMGLAILLRAVVVAIAGFLLFGLFALVIAVTLSPRPAPRGLGRLPASVFALEPSPPRSADAKGEPVPTGPVRREPMGAGPT